MKLLFSVLLGSLLVYSISAQETSAQATDATRQELIALSTQWMDAVVRKDRPALERVLADDYYYAPAGELEITDRSAWLKRAMELDWLDLRYRNIKVDVYQDMAVVTALVDSKLGIWGIPLHSDVQVTDIWAKRNGQWQVVARHLGASSVVGQVRVALGFAAGLSLCFAAWLFLRLKRRFAAKGKLTAI